jgi:DNA-binding GntR family transcriptional regulator
MSVPRRKIERVALQEQVYELLKERVLDRGYAADEKLNIDALSRELQVSSTPIREALGRLAAEGLVRAQAFVGFAVAPMPPREHYDQLFEFRLLVEPWAAGRTAVRRPPAILDELEAAVAAMSQGRLARHYQRFRDFSQADEAFHRAILAGTGNGPALKAIGDLRIHLHLSRLYISREQDTSVTHRQHLAVFEAIRAGDAELAAERMREHLVLSRSKLLDDTTQ